MAFSFLKVLFCLLPATVLFAQPYNFVTFSLPEGLPQSQVFAMCQDRRGYLWLGTQGGGLSRFDGQRFETFTTADGLPSNYINALLEDAQHRLWVGTNQGLCRFDGRRFEPVGLAGVRIGVLGNGGGAGQAGVAHGDSLKRAGHCSREPAGDRSLRVHRRGNRHGGGQREGNFAAGLVLGESGDVAIDPGPA